VDVVRGKKGGGGRFDRRKRRHGHLLCGTVEISGKKRKVRKWRTRFVCSQNKKFRGGLEKGSRVARVGRQVGVYTQVIRNTVKKGLEGKGGFWGSKQRVGGLGGGGFFGKVPWGEGTLVPRKKGKYAVRLGTSGVGAEKGRGRG